MAKKVKAVGKRKPAPEAVVAARKSAKQIAEDEAAAIAKAQPDENAKGHPTGINAEVD